MDLEVKQDHLDQKNQTVLGSLVFLENLLLQFHPEVLERQKLRPVNLVDPEVQEHLEHPVVLVDPEILMLLEHPE
jgi:hypothetical protein